MKCPECKERQHIELDLHSDGFSENVRECGDCGAMWTWKDDKRIIIKHGSEYTRPAAKLPDWWVL